MALFPPAFDAHGCGLRQRLHDDELGEVTLDELFGGRFVHRRLRPAHAAGALTAAGGVSDAPHARGPRAANFVETAPQDFVWLAAEPLGGLQLGQEVSLNRDTDIGAGDRVALALRQGSGAGKSRGGHWLR